MEIEKYSLIYHKDVFYDDFPLLSVDERQNIQTAIKVKLMTDPIGYGRTLKGSDAGCRYLNVGLHSVSYKINANARLVTVISIRQRSNIY